ncbi:MAG: hypothetical protein GMKNLPBB_00563 [Myxococcota bacterium]|nr:hypothetical protein [Myxococcota bacterium]
MDFFGRHAPPSREPEWRIQDRPLVSAALPAEVSHWLQGAPSFFHEGAGRRIFLGRGGLDGLPVYITGAGAGDSQRSLERLLKTFRPPCVVTVAPVAGLAAPLKEGDLLAVETVRDAARMQDAPLDSGPELLQALVSQCIARDVPIRRASVTTRPGTGQETGPAGLWDLDFAGAARACAGIGIPWLGVGVAVDSPEAILMRRYLDRPGRWVERLSWERLARLVSHQLEIIAWPLRESLIKYNCSMAI